MILYRNIVKGRLIEETNEINHRYRYIESLAKDEGDNNFVTRINFNKTTSSASLITSPDRSITYNSNNKPTEIIKHGQITDQFEYGSDEARYKQTTSNGITTYYIDGLFEMQVDNGKTTTKAYLGDYAVISKGEKNPGLRYLHKDRLGSVETITDGDNEIATIGDINRDGQNNALDLIVEQRVYDVFGEARLIADNNPNNDQWHVNGVTNSGYTGHEHLQSGLIHMNGRAYDPKTGRFLSVDPFITFPDNGQSINPYSYVMNNPLSSTDPTGYLVHNEIPNNYEPIRDCKIQGHRCGVISINPLSGTSDTTTESSGAIDMGQGDQPQYWARGLIGRWKYW